MGQVGKPGHLILGTSWSNDRIHLSTKAVACREGGKFPGSLKATDTEADYNLCMDFPLCRGFRLTSALFKGQIYMGLLRQEYWNGLPFPSPADLPDPGIELRSPTL